MEVRFGQVFLQHFQNFPKSDQLKIKEFVNHVKSLGFEGLTGRNKSSDNVPTDNPDWSKIVAYAQKNQLWHYHIGIPSYVRSEKGDMTSEYVLHYVKGDDYIKLVDLSAHPPLKLPMESYLA
ncbi:MULTISPECIES: hypothetical protein [unclassified Moraxella]|uniref:hypothetical protein n=1 Tax=unclassified Moraxella TaxID=2685852 RepID=UPI003AF6BEDE